MCETIWSVGQARIKYKDLLHHFVPQKSDFPVSQHVLSILLHTPEPQFGKTTALPPDINRTG